jgi:hypothetical protein
VREDGAKGWKHDDVSSEGVEKTLLFLCCRRRRPSGQSRTEWFSKHGRRTRTKLPVEVLKKRA